jgi:hypothetical protein
MKGSSNRIHIGGLQLPAGVLGPAFRYQNDLGTELLRGPADLPLLQCDVE